MTLPDSILVMFVILNPSNHRIFCYDVGKWRREMTTTSIGSCSRIMSRLKYKRVSDFCLATNNHIVKSLHQRIINSSQWYLGNGQYDISVGQVPWYQKDRLASVQGRRLHGNWQDYMLLDALHRQHRYEYLGKSTSTSLFKRPGQMAQSTFLSCV